MIVGKYYRNREEACISGGKGCGVVYLGGCNMHCVYCLEHAISQQAEGIDYAPPEFARLLLRLQEQGVSHISIANAEPFAEEIAVAADFARNNGLIIPLLNNFNGYASEEMMQRLMPVFDGYVMDVKYADNVLCRRFSGVLNYRENAISCLRLLSDYYGKNEYSGDGLLLHGVLLRHLILPGLLQNTRDVLTLISQNNSQDYPLDLMADFVPEYRAASFFRRPYSISQIEKDSMAGLARSLNIALTE